MKSSRRLGVFIVILGIGGAALFVTLLVRHGFSDILAAFERAGWWLPALVGYRMVTLTVDAMSWRALIPAEVRPSFGRLLYIHWIGDSVSNMLPVAQVGGEVVRVRLAAARGVPTAAATSSVLVGLTLSVATQILFTLSGLTVLVALATEHDAFLVRTIIIASIVGVACVAGFFGVQRLGMFRMAARIIAHVASNEAWQDLVSRGEDFDRDLRAAYARRGAIIQSTLWTLATWASGAVETWIALHALGISAGYGQAYALESVSQGVRSAFFLVPGALGFQEGGFLGAGRLLGIAAPEALALSLLQRARDMVLGIPGVLAWQLSEGRGLWSRRNVPPVVQPATPPPAAS